MSNDKDARRNDRKAKREKRRRDKHSDKTKGPVSNDHADVHTGVCDVSLPVASLATLAISPDTPWNIIKVGHGKEGKLHNVLNNKLNVLYPKGSYKPSAEPEGGIGFYACPKTVFPCQEVSMSYKFTFGENFDPVKGGKLPGLFIGEPGASGGNHPPGCASARLMWREANKDGTIAAEAYVYIPEKQNDSYSKISGLVRNATYGDSLWRNDLQFNAKGENEILLSIKMNTFKDNKAQNDGSVRLVVNGKYRVYDELVWVDKYADIEGITFDTFFGGGSADWACKDSTFITFYDFRCIRDPIPDYIKPTDPQRQSFPNPTILSLVSIAENSSIDPEWGYAENIKDGRGITFSICGFCSGTGDGSQCLSEYIKLETNGDDLLKGTLYCNAMKQIDKQKKNKDTEDGLEGFIEWFNRVGVTKPMMAATMNVIQKLYWYPALDFLAKRKLVTPLSAYIAYDTILNFGELDAFENIPYSDVTVQRYLKEFLDVKQKVIEKKKSLGDSKNNRVDMQKALVAQNKLELQSPLNVSCYGDSYTL